MDDSERLSSELGEAEKAELEWAGQFLAMVTSDALGGNLSAAEWLYAFASVLLHGGPAVAVVMLRDQLRREAEAEGEGKGVQ